MNFPAIIFLWRFFPARWLPGTDSIFWKPRPVPALRNNSCFLGYEEWPSPFLFKERKGKAEGVAVENRLGWEGGMLEKCAWGDVLKNSTQLSSHLHHLVRNKRALAAKPLRMPAVMAASSQPASLRVCFKFASGNCQAERRLWPHCNETFLTARMIDDCVFSLRPAATTRVAEISRGKNSWYYCM